MNVQPFVGSPAILWNERVLRACFWTLNIGLALMALLTLLPIGTIQLLAAIDRGYWYARSAGFMHQPLVELLVWMRVPGDTIFSIGAVLLTWFVIRLWIAPKQDVVGMFALRRGRTPRTRLICLGVALAGLLEQRPEDQLGLAIASVANGRDT